MKLFNEDCEGNSKKKDFGTVHWDGEEGLCREEGEREMTL